MAIRNAKAPRATETSGAASDLLNKNMLTTAGVLVGGSTAVAAGALVTFALPAQVLGAAAISGGLIYAGDCQAKGKSINPFQSSEIVDPSASDEKVTGWNQSASPCRQSANEMTHKEVVAYNLEQALNTPVPNQFEDITE